MGLDQGDVQVRKVWTWLAAAGCAGIVAAPALSQESPVSEVRGGVFSHSIDPDGFSRVEDVNFEVLFRAPFMGSFGAWGTLQPRIGATVNLNGPESMVNLGVTWHLPVFDTPLFLEGTFGGALHNGALHDAVAPARDLGCSVLFYEAASVGFEVTEQVNLLFTAEHASHAGLCGDDNRGLTNGGVRLGIKF